MRLRTKLFLPLVIFSFLIAGYLQFAWLPKVSSSIIETHDAALMSHLKTAEEGLVPLLLENQLANVYESLSALAEKNADWIAISLYDNSGRRLYPISLPKNISDGPNIKTIRQPVGFTEPFLGELVVVIDNSIVIAKAVSLQNTFSFALFSLLTIFILVIGVIFELVVRRRLLDLAKASDQLANGNYEARLPLLSSDEIGALTRSFSTMRKALQAYHYQLKGEIDNHKQTEQALKEEKNKADYHATHDSLTHLINRREFERRLAEAVDDAVHNNGVHAMLYMDLDQFKVVNDTCGHVAGDALLEQLSITLSDVLRQHDTLARIGGDEFGVLLQYCSLEDACQVAENLKSAVHDFRFIWDEKPFAIGASIGLVAVDGNSGDLSHVLSAADSACYVAKENGRNQVHVYHGDDELLVHQKGEMQWVTRLVEAMQKDHFALYCQPIVSLSDLSEKNHHFEILLRLIEDDGTVTTPGSFIPAAERYNLIASIDRWVVDKTLDFLEVENINVNFSINLSGASLGNKGLLDHIEKRLDEIQLNDHQLCFEVTETTAIINLAAAREFIERIKKYKCKFSLDDFGYGMSSFSYLKMLPVDYLKIDGAFVKDMVKDPIDLAMVSSINDIGHTMEIETIAEFVECKEVFDKLKDIGVDYAQGYYLSEPFPIANLVNRVDLKKDSLSGK